MLSVESKVRLRDKDESAMERARFQGTGLTDHPVGSGKISDVPDCFSCKSALTGLFLEMKPNFKSLNAFAELAKHPDRFH